MPDHASTAAPASDGRWPALAILTGAFAAAAFLAPLWAPEPHRACGLLLFGGAITELVQGFRRRTREGQRAAWQSGGLTLLLGLLIFNMVWIATTALTVIVAIPFALDAIRYIRLAIRQRSNRDARRRAILAAIGNLSVTFGLYLLGRYAFNWVIGAAAGMRLAGAAFNLAAAPVFATTDADESVVADLGIDRPERLTALAARVEAEEQNRVAADWSWVAALFIVLFTIHVSRMGFDRSALGIFSPLVAVVGDAVFALVLAYAVIVPLRLLLRRSSIRLARRGWEWVLDERPVPVTRRPLKALVRWWLVGRLRLSIRLRSARYSMTSALGRGLQIGLPLSAVIVASVPIWGMSWYFDTENWASGAWDSWAAGRTDTWRAAMVRAVIDAGESAADGTGFAVSPPGVGGSAPFSFIVIGDTGEGDSSQHVLRDQLIRAASSDDVRFVVVSSDVIYPSGAMKDYETKFYLPFKGVTKPVYAIPGNHDWYDALDGFVAAFFTPASARTAIRARISVDQGLSSTTDAMLEGFVKRADFLRREYGVPTGFQQAPFFQVQTPSFALLAIDTGVLRGVDPEEMKWLRAALEASRGKTIMAILGHPFYAGGHDTSSDDKEFLEIRELLRTYDVRLIMAGDTHDMEYYEEKRIGGATVHHWVNGGGGAYLSYGAPLAWPKSPITNDWAFYPGRKAVVQKIESLTPWWKWPAWWWTREWNAWPSSAEWLSAMFDYNNAPFFQSFIVVTVDPAANRVTLRPWGVHGPLTWKDFDRSPAVVPAGTSLDAPVEWVINR